MQAFVFAIFYVLSVFLCIGCQHGTVRPENSALPSWIERPKAVGWDAKANAMAQMACRKGKTVLSANDKIALQVFEAHHRILKFTTPTNNQHNPSKWNGTIDREATALKATHIGAFDAQVKQKRCIAVVLLRRHLNNRTYLPQTINPKNKTPFRLELERPIQNPELFVQHPSGKIDRQSIQIDNGNLSFAINGGDWPKGHYIIEVLGQTERGNPEILFWWRLTHKERMPHPWPRLRYEELSQTNQARSMKIENMIVQLRGTALAHRLHVSPQLRKVAQIRAEALSRLHGIGHNRPHNQTPDQTLRENFTRPEVVKIAEIQSQSATLKESWDGIVESPAHVLPLISKGVSHMGASAVLGEDAAGNPSVTVVILLGSDEKLQLSAQQLRLHLIAMWNEYRDNRDLPRLVRHGNLEKEAQHVAAQMAHEGPVQSWTVEKGLIPGLLNKIEDLNQITGTLLYSNTPKALDKAPWLQNKDFSTVGVGLVKAPNSDLWFLCILVGERAD